MFIENAIEIIRKFMSKCFCRIKWKNKANWPYKSAFQSSAQRFVAHIPISRNTHTCTQCARLNSHAVEGALVACSLAFHGEKNKSN